MSHIRLVAESFGYSRLPMRNTSAHPEAVLIKKETHLVIYILANKVKQTSMQKSAIFLGQVLVCHFTFDDH